MSQLKKLQEQLAQVSAAVTKEANAVETAAPVGKVDNQTQPQADGARGKEHDSDVKKDHGAATETKHTSESQQMSIGITSTPTGEDPAVEKDYKDKPTPVDTSAPINKAASEKYASATFAECHKASIEQGEKLLASFARGQKIEKTAAATEAPKTPAKVEKTAEEASFSEGYKLAAAIGMTEEQARTAVEAQLACSIKKANDDADAVASFLAALAQKQAEEMEDDDADDDDDDDDKPAPKEPGKAAMVPPTEEVPPAPPVEEPAMPPAAPMGGGEDPAAMGMGEIPEEQKMMIAEELAQAAMEAGLTPEDLISMIQQPDEVTDPAGMPVAKVASLTLSRMANPSFKVEKAKNASLRADFVNYLKNIVK